MKHQIQPNDGCFPAVVAMLLGIDVQEVVDYGLSLGKHKQWAHTEDYWGYHTMICAVATHYHVPYRWAIMTTDTPTLASSKTVLPTGRGAIVIRKDLVGAHIIAYENQLVYDGALPEVISWDAWYDLKIVNEKWSITEITPFNPNTEGGKTGAIA